MKSKMCDRIRIAHRVNVIVNDPFVGRATVMRRVKLVEWVFQLVAEAGTEMDRLHQQGRTPTSENPDCRRIL